MICRIATGQGIPAWRYSVGGRQSVNDPYLRSGTKANKDFNLRFSIESVQAELVRRVVETTQLLTRQIWTTQEIMKLQGQLVAFLRFA